MPIGQRVPQDKVINIFYKFFWLSDRRSVLPFCHATLYLVHSPIYITLKCLVRTLHRKRVKVQ